MINYKTNSITTFLGYPTWLNKTLTHKQGHVIGQILGYVNKVAIDKNVLNQLKSVNYWIWRWLCMGLCANSHIKKYNVYEDRYLNNEEND